MTRSHLQHAVKIVYDIILMLEGCIETMEAETQTEEEQVNIIEPSDPITPMGIGNFAPGTDSMDPDAEIENHERQLEQTLLQLKIAKSVAEAKQFCTTDLDDFDDDFEDFFE